MLGGLTMNLTDAIASIVEKASIVPGDATIGIVKLVLVSVQLFPDCTMLHWTQINLRNYA